MSETAELHAEVVRRAVQALNDRNPAALLELVTDDIVWHFPGRNALSGDPGQSASPIQADFDFKETRLA